MWSCTTTFISALMAWHIIKHRDNFTFYLTNKMVKFNEYTT